jgi:hypothetical protein
MEALDNGQTLERWRHALHNCDQISSDARRVGMVATENGALDVAGVDYDQLAERCGLTVEAVTAAFRELADAGFVEAAS